MILNLIMIKNFVWGHWKTLLPSFLFICAIIYHINYRPDTIIKPYIIDPNTKPQVLKGGGKADVKVSTPSTKTPIEVGFSKVYLNDTINKILKVKNNEIKSINKINSTFVDSLKLVKQDLDESNRVVKYYESRDNKGNVVGSGKTTDGGNMVYKGNIELTSVVKLGKTVDTLKFYDPTGRFTVNKSLEYNYLVEPKKVKKKITMSVQVGAGVVMPNFKVSNATLGGYGGVGASYNF